MDTSTSARDAYSPEFLSAVERILADEGGYSSNPSDPGGATKFGISARSNPGVNIATLTRDQAVNIYWREWWLRFGFAQLPDAIGAKTFDLAVNIGAAHAIECLRRALRACDSPVTEVGALGRHHDTRRPTLKPHRTDVRVALRGRRLLPPCRRERKKRRRLYQGMAQPRLRIRI